LLVFVPFLPPLPAPRAFFSVKQRKRAFMRGRKTGVGLSRNLDWKSLEYERDHFFLYF
jgi:hypothetical protein